MKIKIDREWFGVFESFYRDRGFTELPPTPTATGEQLRHVGGVPDNRSLHGGSPDHAIGIREAVPLTDGMEFISVPPASY